jgi:protein-L-isoaspartate(D-aspartate) O-methyltransferase
MFSRTRDHTRKIHRMIHDQIKGRGITDERVLEAMASVPRDQFVPESLISEAYDDGALPIGHEQTISQPFTVAFMLQALELTGDERVLEIGTGSGYAAALLSRLAKEVHTVERIPELADQAHQRLAALGCENVHVHVGDGTFGLPEFAPYDAIIVAAGATSLPDGYAKQVAENGTIVIPIGTSQRQSMMKYTKHNGKLACEDLGGFTFVPLVGEHGWSRKT